MTDPLDAVHAALLTCGAAPVDVICVGDSITEGMIAGHREDAWPQRLRDLLRAGRFSGSVKGGIGYCPSYSVSASVSDFWARRGTINDAGLSTGLGCRCLKAPLGSSASLSFTGTGLDLLTTTGEHSALSWSLDNRAPVTVDQRQSNGLQSGVVIPLRGLCDGPHTITVAGTTLGNAYVEGAMVYRNDEDAGIRVWEGGHSGCMCSDFNASPNWWGSFRAVPNPKLVIVCLGANEYTNGVTSAQYGRALDQLLTMIQSLLGEAACSLLVVSPHARMPLSGRANQSYYEAQAAAVAARHGAAYLSMTPVIGDCAAGIASGLLQSGQGIHPTSAGHLLYAQALAEMLLP
jgi:lysophospholipase L1-like esterase